MDKNTFKQQPILILVIHVWAPNLENAINIINKLIHHEVPGVIYISTILLPRM